MVVYLTGTGNSRYCAEMIADKLNDELLNAFHFIKDGIKAELVSTKPWVFVCPTYAWQIPHIFEDFIRKSWLQGRRDAYFVMTCGSEIGNAGEGLEELCNEVGLKYKGVLEVLMPENYIAMFDVPQKDEARSIIAAAAPVLEAGIKNIQNGEPFPPVKTNVVDRMKSGKINKLFYKHFIKAKKFYSTDACIHCGKCADVCVLNNIKLTDGKPVWGDSCTHCMACICDCPTEAIEYGRASKGKWRYKCSEYGK